jgi:hypothetical protein
LTVRTNGMSTQIFGEYDVHGGAFVRNPRIVQHPHSVFVMKIINADSTRRKLNDSIINLPGAL